MTNEADHAIASLLRGVKDLVRLEQFCGVTHYQAQTEVVPASAPESGSSMSLSEYCKTIENCQLCSLGEIRTNFVFGVGNPQASLVFVGEAPGEDEDLQGVPFVGRAGQLLTKIIQAIDLQRENVYICNVLKCRPPDNRNPQPNEIELCEPYLIRQLEIIKPKIICTLGNFAAKTLLKTQDSVMRLRGQVFSYHGIPLIPTLHPAACLYRPENKRLVWEDIQKVQQMLNEV